MYCIKDMTCGLQYLHQNNIVHKNLKSSNVLFDDYNCTWKLSDVGQDSSENVTEAPSKQNDIFSLGIMIYEICHVVDGDYHKQLTNLDENEKLPKIGYRISAFHPDLDVVVRAMIQYPVENRVVIEQVYKKINRLMNGTHIYLT